MKNNINNTKKEKINKTVNEICKEEKIGFTDQDDFDAFMMDKSKSVKITLYN